MKPALNFDQPDKICPSCGAVIPVNGLEYNSKGEVVRDSKGVAIFRKYGYLFCETCCRNALPPSPPVRRLRKGERPEGQMEIDEGTGIRID